MRRHKNNNLQSGFTLLELMTVIVVAGILFAIGLPQFEGYINSSRLTAQSNSLLTSLHFARNEAITRGHSVNVLSLNGSNIWTNGWQVRLDVDNQGDIDVEDIAIRTYEPIQNSTLIGDASRVTYKATGFAKTTVKITLRPNNCRSGTQQSVIRVRLSGLAIAKRESC